MLIYTEEYISDLIGIQKSIPNLKDLYKRKVLITGSTGLIGSAIIDFMMELNHQCNAEIKIYAAARSEDKLKRRFPRTAEAYGLYYVKYDAETAIDFELDVDFIIHGASNAHPKAFVKEPVDTMVANIYGVKNLLEYTKKHAVRRILYISSSEVYGKRNNNHPYVEDDYGYLDLLNPRACYPMSKRAAETLCAAYIEQYDIDAVIVRPGHVYGPTMTADDSRASSQFPRDVKAGKNIVMKSAGLQLRSYCYVLDCVSAIITVLLNGKNGEAYNISNKDSIVCIRDMAECFARISKSKVVFEKAEESERMGYNLMDNSSLDSVKIESLGWRGLFSMESGAQRTLNSLA